MAVAQGKKDDEPLDDGQAAQIARTVSSEARLPPQTRSFPYAL